MLDQEKMDGVAIATNYTSHYAITRDCLNHDLHVMVEKPMTVYAHDARRLVDLGGTWWRGRDDGRIVRMKSWRAANEN
jgi:hypothetical protein